MATLYHVLRHHSVMRVRNMPDDVLYHTWGTLLVDELLDDHTPEVLLRRRLRCERELIKREMLPDPGSQMALW